MCPELKVHRNHHGKMAVKRAWIMFVKKFTDRSDIERSKKKASCDELHKKN